jgi:peptidoglycan L-alanyl-D-glutamate endopeptidase CwlK
MNQLSENSLKELATCHKDLQAVIKKAIQLSPLDFSIVQGARTVDQARLNFKNGASKLDPDKGEFSKHIVGSEAGRELSFAVDICPYNNGLNWNDDAAFYVIAGVILATAKDLGIGIRYGGGWDLYKGVNHLNTAGQLKDLGHFELI